MEEDIYVEPDHSHSSTFVHPRDTTHTLPGRDREPQQRAVAGITPVEVSSHPT